MTHIKPLKSLTYYVIPKLTSNNTAILFFPAEVALPKHINYYMQGEHNETLMDYYHECVTPVSFSQKRACNALLSLYKCYLTVGEQYKVCSADTITFQLTRWHRQLIMA